MKEMYPKNGRVILHVDMNSFYASVEVVHDPLLKGKPLAIAGNPKERRGIIITSSYEARARGVKTTMPVWEAKRLCPELIIRKPNFPLYRKASKVMFQLLSNYTDKVQPVSIDEGFLDITNSYTLGAPFDIAKMIQYELKEELGLPCSIGIAPNKFLAKMASNMKKPLGITILRKRDIGKVLWPMPVEEMHGVGKKTALKLEDLGIYSIGDLANANELLLEKRLGVNGVRLKAHANGNDRRIVDPDAISDFKSIGNSTTLPEDTVNNVEVKATFGKLSETVALRLNRENMVSFNIQITIRYSDRRTITRSKKLINPIGNKDEILHVAMLLLEKHWNGEPIRLLGITASDLEVKQEVGKQLDLFSFEHDAKVEPLFDVITTLNQKFGNDAVTKGVKQKQKHQRENASSGTSFQKDFLRSLNLNNKEET